MAPQSNTAPPRNNRQLTGSGPHGAASPVEKSGKTTGSRPSSPLQEQSTITRPHPVDSSSIAPAPLSAPARTKRKCSPDLEADADKEKEGRPAKQPRRRSDHRLDITVEEEPKDSQAGANVKEPEDHAKHPQEPPPLSDQDSKSLKLLYEEVMSSSKALKRTLSRRSIIQSETETNQTQPTSSTNNFYRHKNLAAVNIRFHVEPTGEIETTIQGVVGAQVSEQRRAELQAIARNFHNGCLRNVRADTGEDDFLRPLQIAIEALDLQSLCVREKAAWRKELKPVVWEQSRFSSNFMARVKQLEVGGNLAPAQKPQQQSATVTYISPEASPTNMPVAAANQSQDSSAMHPPPLPAPKIEGDRAPVKTPHPDLFMGIHLPALISALSSQNLSEAEATTFIEWLQNETVQHMKDRPVEPMLLLIPASRALDLTFPFAVIEGKAYSTGKQIYEAENQAAVSLACAHKILLCLDRMANAGTTTMSAPHVLYSITTQGPIHELWIHWTALENGVRTFDSKLWDSWNALVPGRAEDFIVKLNNVCAWGTGPFMQSVVQSLERVAVQAEA